MWRTIPLIALLMTVMTAHAAPGEPRDERSALADALQPGDPFARIKVVAGASPNAAARTLDELKQILAGKVRDGELSQAEANRILSRYNGVLVVMAQGASPKPVDSGAPIRVIETAPTPTEAIAAASPTPVSITAATPPKSAQTELPALAVSSTAFNQLALALAGRRPRPEPAGYSAASSDAADSISRGPWPSFGGETAARSSGGGSPATVSVYRSSPSPNLAASASNAPPNLRVVSGMLRGDSSRRPASLRIAVASSESSFWNGPRLSAGQRFRLLAGLSSVIDDNGDAIDPPYPPWINWFFAVVLALLCGRAIWQWRHRRT